MTGLSSTVLQLDSGTNQFFSSASGNVITAGIVKSFIFFLSIFSSSSSESIFSVVSVSDSSC